MLFMSAPFSYQSGIVGPNRSFSVDEEASPCFLGVEEKELAFSEPVFVNGALEEVDDGILLRCSIRTKASFPCSICNESIFISIEIKELAHFISFADCKRGRAEFSGPIREAILLEIPLTAECGGSCPNRKEIQQYLVK